jgi:hypothetical protein
MMRREHAFQNLLCLEFATMLGAGVLLSTASGEASADNVDVQVAVVAVQGYSSPPPSPYDQSSWGCSEAQMGPDSAPYVICVSPASITTKADKQGDPVRITWNLTGAGWAFPTAAGGIYIKKKKHWWIKSNSATQYQATNIKESGAVEYSYTVGVINAGYLLTGDPMILN